MKEELQQAHCWRSDHKLSLNLKKTKIMFFGMAARLSKINEVNLVINEAKIEHVNLYDNLGVTLDSKLNFGNHIEAVRQNAIPKIKTLGRIIASL